MSTTKLPLWKELNAARTQGKWTINHWSKGDSGIYCKELDKNGINYYTGDAVNENFYGVRSPIDPARYKVQGSFEGAHITDITDFKGLDNGKESKANAQYITMAVNNLYILAMTLEKIIAIEDEKYYSGLRAADIHNNTDGVGIHFDYMSPPPLPNWVKEAQEVLNNIS